MLVKLFVQNYALIKELDLKLENGLTIITGETGAGKSILLGALSLILGSRADTTTLLDKDRKCIVEGSFMLEENYLKDFFIDNDLDYDSINIVRREVNPVGKSRAFINDTPVTVNLLKEFGEKLIDIHSQHQTLMLNESSFHLNIIDSFADISNQKSKFIEIFHNYKRLKREYLELKESVEKNASDLEYYRFQLEQLESAELKPGEQEEMEAERDILTHSEELKLALGGSYNLFLSDEISILVLLREVKNKIDKIQSFLPAGNELFTRIDSSIIELDDIASEIGKLSESADADPFRLAEINERLDIIYQLIQKHRVDDLNGLINKREEIKGIVSSSITGEGRLADMEKIIEKETNNLNAISEEMSVKRQKVFPEIEASVTELLKQLGMPNAKFKISHTRLNEFTSSGIDHTDFLFSANRQNKPENLAKIASGGELSRVMLCLKSLLTRNKNLPTIIFDEIDSGVSGEVADKVGQILAGMGKYMQVINITHLPQVASRGKKHYHVYKDDVDDSTFTSIKLLSPDERILELARLLSGSEVTDTALKNARELLDAAIN